MFVNPNDPLEDQAIDWLVLERSGDASPEELRDLETWLAADSRHRAAFRSAQELWRDVGDALRDRPPETPCLGNAMNIAASPSSETDGKPVGTATQGGAAARPTSINSARHGLRTLLMPPVMKRVRPKRRMGLAIAAMCAAVALIARPLVMQYYFGDYSTTVGEQREINLSDGTTILIDSDSALADQSDPHVRRLELLRGQAQFTVAPDRKRPFEIQAGSASIRALGTTFQLSRGSGDRFRVSVTEHAVEVFLNVDAKPSGIRVEKGQMLAYAGSGPLGTPVLEDLAVLTAWQRGKLIFNDRPVAEVVSELNRYRHGRILITDPKIAAMKVSGVFPVKNIDDSMEILEKALGVRATRLGPLLTVLHS